MQDTEFIERFEAGAIPDFHHREHIRAAWLYLGHYPVLEALRRFTEGLKHFAAAHGKTNLYHETITWAYVFLVHDRMRRAGDEQSWEEFLAANPDLLDWKNSILKAYYREETLRSELARQVFLFPDKDPSGQVSSVTITFDDERAVTLERLDERQAARPSAILEASGVWYRWDGRLVTRPTFSDRISAAWRRLNAWLMAPLILLALLSAPAFAQKPITPVRVSFVTTAEESATDIEFTDHLLAELNKLKTVAFRSQNADYDIATACAPITRHYGDEVVGYACAALVVAPEGGSRRRFWLSIQIAPTLAGLAANLASYLDKEFFQTSRR
jgi:hypothetical protein